MGARRIVLEIELPSMYVDDLDDLREYRDHFDSDSEWLMNCIGEPGPACRLRVPIHGEKDGSTVEVWGHVIGAKLQEQSAPNVDEKWLAEQGWELLRDEDSCEWCDSDTNGCSE